MSFRAGAVRGWRGRGCRSLPPSRAPPAAAVARGGEALKADCIAMVAFDSGENTTSISAFHFFGGVPARRGQFLSIPACTTNLPAAAAALWGGLFFLFSLSFFFFLRCLLLWSGIFSLKSFNRLGGLCKVKFIFKVGKRGGEKKDRVLKKK